MFKLVLLAGASAPALALGGMVSPTYAQSTTAAAEAPTSFDVEEIIVTAQRRAQRLQDVPVVVTAIDVEQLEEKGITSTGDLSRLTPGITNFVGNGFVMPSLRGIGSQNNAAGATGTVAIYLDGVYLASPQGSLFSYNNIAQIEVDKGPQGTLFGRNATAGVIQVKTRDPKSTFEGRVSVGIDNYATTVGKLYLTGPIAGNLSADVAVIYSDQHEGYGKNVVTGQDVYKTRDFNIRSKWLWTPTDIDRITATFDYGDLKDSSATIHFLGIPYNYGIPGFNQPLQSDLGDPWNISAAYQPLVRTKQGGGSLEYFHDFGGVHLTNIFAIRHTDNFLISPSGSLPPYDVSAYQAHVYRQTSEEIRLSSPDTSKVAWTAGFFYLSSDSTNELLIFIES